MSRKALEAWRFMGRGVLTSTFDYCVGRKSIMDFCCTSEPCLVETDCEDSICTGSTCFTNEVRVVRQHCGGNTEKNSEEELVTFHLTSKLKSVKGMGDTIYRQQEKKRNCDGGLL